MVPTRDHRSRRASVRHPAALAALALVLALVACSGEAPLPGDPLRLVASPLPDAIQGEPYQEDLVPTGGLRPYTFTLEEGALPPGLALQGGTLIGTPEEVGRYAFTVSVSDARLSTTYEDWVLTVRELPVPVFDLAVPETEVRGDVVLRGGVREARDLRALRVWIEWQDPGLSLGAAGVQASRDDVALFVDEREDGVAIDLAVLGEPIDGDAELFRLTLNAAEATIVGVDARSEALYAGRHAFDEARIGAPRPTPPTAPEAEGEGDAAGDEPGSGRNGADEAADGEAGTPVTDPDGPAGAGAGDDPAADEADAPEDSEDPEETSEPQEETP